MKSVFAFLTSLITFMSLSYAQAETYGTMMVVKGDIKVASVKSGKVENAKVGFKVYEGDSITAGADSRAKIIMSDKNVLNISPDSKVTIAKYENNSKKDSRNVELKVDYGKVRASVEQQYDGEKNKFNIRTPTAVAGVRGTDFLAGFNPKTRQTQVVTFSGVVAVGQAGMNGQITSPVFVQPGQSTVVGEGQTPEAPKALPKEQMQDMSSESQAETAQNSPVTEPQPTKSQASSDEAKKEDSKKAEPKTAAASTEKAAGPETGTDKKETLTQTESAKSTSKAADTKSERSPSSVPASGSGSSSMIGKGDLDTTNLAKEIKITETPKTPVIIKAPALVTTPAQNNAITEIIQNKNSKVKIEFCLPGKC